MLSVVIAAGCPLAREARFVRESCAGLGMGEELALLCGARVELRFEKGGLKPFYLDFSAHLSRLKRGGRHAEAAARAVIGRLACPAVVDASAGLGRDALVLQHAGARVVMFERNPVIWLLLRDALRRAEEDAGLLALLPRGLPELMPCGSYRDYLAAGGPAACAPPDVIYYDPMFPVSSKSALVKREMRILRSVAGHDADSLEYGAFLRSLGAKRLVIKRPSSAPPLFPSAYAVSGKNCRFDCYTPLPA